MKKAWQNFVIVWWPLVLIAVLVFAVQACVIYLRTESEMKIDFLPNTADTVFFKTDTAK